MAGASEKAMLIKLILLFNENKVELRAKCSSLQCQVLSTDSFLLSLDVVL